jgi:hypothetical protein
MELCRLILVGATNPFLSHGAVMTPMIDWSPLIMCGFVLEHRVFLVPEGYGIAGLEL